MVFVLRRVILSRIWCCTTPHSFDGTPQTEWCDYDVGGLSFSNSALADSVDRPFLRASAGRGKHVERMAATGLTVLNPHGCKQVGANVTVARCLLDK